MSIFIDFLKSFDEPSYQIMGILEAYSTIFESDDEFDPLKTGGPGHDTMQTANDYFVHTISKSPIIDQIIGLSSINKNKKGNPSIIEYVLLLNTQLADINTLKLVMKIDDVVHKTILDDEPLIGIVYLEDIDGNKVHYNDMWKLRKGEILNDIIDSRLKEMKLLEFDWDEGVVAWPSATTKKITYWDIKQNRESVASHAKP